MADERLLGIVGGVGPESTIDYYRSIVAEFQRRRGDDSYPRVLINSLDAGAVFKHMLAGEGDAIGETVAGVPVLDPSRIHVSALVDWLVGEANTGP